MVKIQIDTKTIKEAENRQSDPFKHMRESFEQQHFSLYGKFVKERQERSRKASSRTNAVNKAFKPKEGL